MNPLPIPKQHANLNILAHENATKTSKSVLRPKISPPRMTSMTSFWCLFLKFQLISHLFLIFLRP